jgi:putative peptidoglycan lipid II flippase
VFGATVVVATMTLGMKLVSLVKESLIAATYGTASTYDAFIIALLVPMAIAGILSGSLNAALIPTYIEIREQEGGRAADRLYATILLWNTTLLVAGSAILATTVRLWLPAIASGFDPAKLALTRNLLYGSLPIVIIVGFSTTWGALLNAGDRFALAAIAPALQPAAIICALGWFGRSWGVYGLLTGTLLGYLLEATVLGAALARRGHPLLPRWHGVTSAFRKVRTQYGACIAGSIMVSGMTLVDQAFASSLGPRSNSALNYGGKLVALALSLGASALGTAILPQLSRMAALRDWNGIRRFLRCYGGMVLAVTVPGTLALIALSPFLVRAMFQHGAFTPADTAMVVKIQIFGLLRIPFSTCLVLVTRTLTALRANHFLLVMSFGSFTLNAALDYLFIRSHGIAGLTLSDFGCSVAVLLCLSVAMYRRLDKRAAGSPA